LPDNRDKESSNNTLSIKSEQSMNVEERLICLYLRICELLPAFAYEIERFSPNQNALKFTDEEVLTVYLFGLLQRRFTVKEAHTYALEHWSAWFPAMPKYEGFNYRLGRLAGVFPYLIEQLLPDIPDQRIVHEVLLTDSMPIILARASRADTAKVAHEIADKGYCASKKLWYHGIKLHALVSRGQGCLSRLVHYEFSKASEHDVQSLRRQTENLHNCSVYADKAYFYHHTDEQCREQNIHIFAVQPCTRSNKTLRLFEQVRNSTISRMRQPIESWFAWLQGKMQIEQASKVRSTKGLLIHIFGRIAAAIIALIFDF
jgi:hypothetical protein